MDQKVTSAQVAQEMTRLIQETQVSGKDQRAQIRLLGALKRRWKLFGQELRYCYDIPGLPQDNLQLGAFSVISVVTNDASVGVNPREN